MTAVCFIREREVRENDEILQALNKLPNNIRVIIVPERFACSYVVALFSKTPKDIVCPRFWELKWAVGCPWNCSYCYLQGTLYGNKMPRLKPWRRIVFELERLFKWAEEEKISLVLNSGELADSCAIPAWTREFLKVCISLLEKYPRHRILLVTKGGVKNIEPLNEVEDRFRKNFIVSFSINADEAAKMFEHGPPGPTDRMRAAKKCEELGYEVRIRIDPMIPFENWKEAYSDLVEKMFTVYELNPNRITLGTLRGLYKTIRFSKDRSWIQFIRHGERTGWGLKPRFEIRYEMYAHVIEKIKEYYSGSIALCKETPEMWRKLGLPNPGTWPAWENCRCNCTY